MTEQGKKNLIMLLLAGGAIYLLTRKQTAVIQGQKPGTMTNAQLAEAYKSMVSSPIRYYYDGTEEDPSSGTPWAVDLAKHTKNYAAVKEIYQKYYSGDLTEDLRSWFNGIELSQYVDTLWNNNSQVMS